LNSTLYNNTKDVNLDILIINAFIDALLLKGVIPGKNSIVGTSSIISKSIPDNQIWAGNSAHFIKNIND
jgi:acetyltransferase with multiple hexapeptide repeat domains